jgi:hypothetical protein
VVRGLVKFIALAKFITGGHEIAPKIHQHFIPGLVMHNFQKHDWIQLFFKDIFKKSGVLEKKAE